MDERKNRISWLGQVKVYVGKCFRLFVNEKQWKNFVTTLILMGIISLVTGKEMFSSFQDTKYGVFTIICGCVWVGLFNSIQSICRERPIIKREHRTGLKLSAYITAHAIYEAFLCAIEALIILLVLYAKDGERIDGDGLVFTPFFDLYFTFFLVIFGSDAIAVFVSSLVRKENTAMTIMPFVLIVQLVMSGAIFHLEGAMETFSNVTVSKWGLDASLRVANTSRWLYDDPDNMKECYVGYCRYMRENNLTPISAEPETEALLAAWGVMTLLTILFLIGSVLVLRLVDRDKRI